MTWVGIDDTDMPDTPGTNQLARQLALGAAERYRCLRIVRHQLCTDPSIPCTSQNGSASLLFEPLGPPDPAWLLDLLRTIMRAHFVPGSDPGLCLTEHVPAAVQDFARQAQREVVTQARARSLAAECGVHLEGLGGTEGGVIGALAAVGLGVTENDGRVIQLGAWPDDLHGIVELEAVTCRGIEVRQADGAPVAAGPIDLVKKLRPNFRAGRIVLTVVPSESPGSRWTALKLR